MKICWNPSRIKRLLMFLVKLWEQLFKLKNYVFELNGFTSVTARFGSLWRKIFFTPKRFEPRPSFFSMSKYRNSRRDSKNFKFFSPQVFQIFDSKHGSPENYSDFFFFVFLFPLLPDRGLCVLRAILLEDIEQSGRNFADILRGECSCT